MSGTVLLDYLEARYAIYLPSYRYVLEHYLAPSLGELREKSAARTVVLLDYETNQSISDLSRPLSHAGLIKQFLEGSWPVR